MFIQLLGKILIAGIRFYQICISPYFVSSCRFYPSCSEYAIIAIRKHGPFRGLLMSVTRILRCNPLHPGGYNPVK
jgi:putative membrane protein insertion efficiency factor